MRVRLTFLTALVLAASLAVPSLPGQEPKEEAGWRQLFNGKDLTGWDTWLGRPYKGKEPVGLNQDPQMVYSVAEVDGRPALRISGAIFGALTSKEEFEDYHLKLQFKWGQKKYPPRDKAKRDSGLLYHCVGPHGAQGSFWMQSLECQIQEGDCGDFWSVAGPLVDVRGVRAGEKGPLTYDRQGKLYEGVTSRIIRDANHEKEGDWNTIEVLLVGDTCVHLVNGKVVMILKNPRRKVGDRVEPLRRGKIQLQSEGAEVFYRDIAVRPLKQIPEEYLK